MTRYLPPPDKLRQKKKTARQGEVFALLKIWRKEPTSKRGRLARKRLKFLGIKVNEANVEGLPQMPEGTEFTNVNLRAAREGMGG